MFNIRFEQNGVQGFEDSDYDFTGCACECSIELWKNLNIDCGPDRPDYKCTYFEDFKMKIRPANNRQCSIDITITHIPKDGLYMEIDPKGNSCHGNASVEMRVNDSADQRSLYTAELCNRTVQQNTAVYYQVSNTLVLHILISKEFTNEIELKDKTKNYTPVRLQRKYTSNIWLPSTRTSTGNISIDPQVHREDNNFYNLTLRVPNGFKASWKVQLPPNMPCEISAQRGAVVVPVIIARQYIHISCPLMTAGQQFSAPYKLTLQRVTVTATTTAAATVTAVATTVIVAPATTAATTAAPAATTSAAPATLSSTTVPTALTPRSSAVTKGSPETTTTQRVGPGDGSGQEMKGNNKVTIAVIVTVVCVLLLLALIIAVVLCRRRRSKKAQSSLKMLTADNTSNCYEMGAEETDRQQAMENAYIDIEPDLHLPTAPHRHQHHGYEDILKTDRQSHQYDVIHSQSNDTPNCSSSTNYEVVCSPTGADNHQPPKQTETGADNDCYHTLTLPEEVEETTVPDSSYTEYYLADEFGIPQTEDTEDHTVEDTNDYHTLEDPDYHTLEDPDYHTLSTPADGTPDQDLPSTTDREHDTNNPVYNVLQH